MGYLTGLRRTAFSEATSRNGILRRKAIQKQVSERGEALFNEPTEALRD